MVLLTTEGSVYARVIDLEPCDGPDFKPAMSGEELINANLLDCGCLKATVAKQSAVPNVLIMNGHYLKVLAVYDRAKTHELILQYGV